jgi:tetratricopeptide (TPR) repeat protein
VPALYGSGNMRSCTNKRVGCLIAMYEFGLLDDPELSQFLEHLINCEHCFDQTYSMEGFSRAFRKHRTDAKRIAGSRPFVHLEENPIKGIRSWPRLPLLVGACIVFSCFLAGAIYTVVWLPKREKSEAPETSSSELANVGVGSLWEELEIPKAVYIPSNNNIILRKPEGAFDRAMAFYETNQFDKAIEQLQTVSELDPNEGWRAGFYLGVSLLLVGRSQDAIVPLKAAAQLRVGVDREINLYYLALAYLKTDQDQMAVRALEEVSNGISEYRAAAQKLRRQIADLKKK